MPQTYTIQSGETLSGIAAKLKTSVSELMKLNPQIKDPNLIYAGATLNIPTITPITPTATSFYAGQIGTWMLPENPNVGYSGVWKEGYVPYVAQTTTPIITSDKQKQFQELQNKINETRNKITELQNKLPQDIQNKNLLTQDKEPKTIDISDQLINDLNARLSSQNLSDKNAAYLATIKPLIDILQTDLEARKKTTEERQGWMDKMAELLGRRTKTEELMTAREEADIESKVAERKALYDEATVLQKQITDLQAERDKTLLDVEGKPIPMALIRGEQEHIEKMYESRISNLNAQLGYKMAMYQAKSGEINEARTWINDLVNAATYDQEYDFKVLSTMLNLHNDEYNELGKDVRAEIGQIVDLQQQMLNLNQTEMREKTDMMIQAANKGITPLSFDQLKQMSLEEVANWAASEIAALPKTVQESPDIINYYAKQVASGAISLENVPAETRNAVVKVLAQPVQPRDFTDEEFREAAKDNKSQNKTFEQTIAEIDANPLIKNKDRAKLIASEIYGKTQQQKPSLWQRIFGGGQTTKIQKPQSSQIQAPQPTVNLKSSIEQYFKDLNSKILEFNRNFLGK